jgi:hypothetical protein
MVAGCSILGSTLGKLRCRGARGQVPAQHAAGASEPSRRGTPASSCSRSLRRGNVQKRQRQRQRRGANKLAAYRPGVPLVVKKVGLTGVTIATNAFADCGVETTPTPVWLARLCAEHACALSISVVSAPLILGLSPCGPVSSYYS